MDNTYTHGTIENRNIVDEMKESFIDYSMSVITSRALPDVRDGLKPVHRRILYSMYKTNMTPDRPHKKSAHLVGNELANYHPHGDAAVYDAMVRLAQDFSMRYPLVDGQGNFGNIDGYEAAAQRYSEARMAKLAQEMLRVIEKETKVDDLEVKLRSRHIKRLSNNECNTEAGIVFLDTLVCMERISDHARNIAEEVLEE